jgi:hypothetical protein
MSGPSARPCGLRAKETGMNKGTALNRQQFLRLATGGSVLLLLQACGGGGDGSSGGSSTPQASSCDPSKASIANNHGHSILIATADLDSATDRSYNIQGTSTHAHTVVLTVAQLRSLKAGQSVVVTSSTDASHSHSVSLCA